MVEGREWLENSPRIGESVMAGMCECNIPNPKGVVLSKDRERIAQLVSAGREDVSEIRLKRVGVRTHPSTPSHPAILPDCIASLASGAFETSSNVCEADLRNGSTEGKRQ